MTVAEYIAFAVATGRGNSLLKLTSDFGVSEGIIPMGKESQSALRIIKHYCKVSIGVAQRALKSRVEGRKITFARC
jgi:hypothetical protein